MPSNKGYRQNANRYWHEQRAQARREKAIAIELEKLAREETKKATQEAAKKAFKNALIEERDDADMITTREESVRKVLHNHFFSTMPKSRTVSIQTEKTVIPIGWDGCESENEEAIAAPPPSPK